MQLDLVVCATGQHDLEVTNAQTRPMSKYVPYAPSSSGDILIRPHQTNIKMFYESVRSKFWEACTDPSLSSDWPYIIPEDTSDIENKYIKNWDDTYWCGTQRMYTSLYGTTHECLVPLYIEQASAVKITLTISTVDGSQTLCTRTLTIQHPDIAPNETETYHDRFCDYFCDYLEHIGVDIGNSNALRIEYDNNLAAINGLDVTSGNMSVVHDYSIVRNLISRERPLLEFNSMLTNLYRDYKMILPQFINLNLCFNPDDLISSRVNSLINNQPFFVVSVSVSCLKNSTWTDATVGDIFTNHYYVPRPRIIPTQCVGEEYIRFPAENALDYLQDYTITDIMHANKIVQPICHWCIVDNPNMLFNLYDGFGAYATDANDLAITSSVYNSLEEAQETYAAAYAVPWNMTEYYPHVYGNCPDPHTTTVDLTLKNYLWSGDNMLTIRQLYYLFCEYDDGDYAQTLIDQRLLQSMSGYVGNYKFNFSADDSTYYDDVYLCICRTAIPVSLEFFDLESSIYNEVISFTLTYNGNTVYLMARSASITNESGSYQHVLIVVIWTSDESTNSVFDNLLYNNLLNSIISEITDILSAAGCDDMDMNEFAGILESIESDDVITQLKELYTFYKALVSLQPFEIIYFNNSLSLGPDITVSQTAQEQQYYKNNDTDEWVYRHSENIRPAIYEPAVERGNETVTVYYYDGTSTSSDETQSDENRKRVSETIVIPGFEDVIRYSDRFGRNFLWLKDKIKGSEISASSEYRKYAYTGTPPSYPSLGYECVNKYTSVRNDGGDLMYDEPLEVFHNLDSDRNSSGLGIWPEYKWFNKSVAIHLQSSFATTVYVLNNDCDDVEDFAFRTFAEYLGMFSVSSLYVYNSYYDVAYLKLHYNIEYNLDQTTRISVTDSSIPWKTLTSYYRMSEPIIIADYAIDNHITLNQYTVNIKLK